jgi:acetate kinase
VLAVLEACRHDAVGIEMVVTAGIATTMRVLVVNAGSSSLKLTLLDGADRILDAVELSAPGSKVDADEVRSALDSSLGEADAVGHRIVHGGERFHEAVRINREVEVSLRELTELAPLHQPKSLAALDAVSEALPGMPAIACFDTAFHRTLPPAAATYALPAEWRERWHLRRYGFHGLSHAWVARHAPEVLGEQGVRLRIVSAHLGAGASLCAIDDGESIDTTMGFTPLEGLVMATRSGSVDPGMLLWLMEHEQLSSDELTDALEHRSGLLGLTGSSDMREVVDRAAEADLQARLGLEVYVHRLRAGIASMAAALEGLDALVFTGGVGEHSSQVRALTVAGLGYLGVHLDAQRNEESYDDREIGLAGAATRTLVLSAREDIEIARQVRALQAR